QGNSEEGTPGDDHQDTGNPPHPRMTQSVNRDPPRSAAPRYGGSRDARGGGPRRIPTATRSGWEPHPSPRHGGSRDARGGGHEASPRVRVRGSHPLSRSRDGFHVLLPLPVFSLPLLGAPVYRTRTACHGPGFEPTSDRSTPCIPATGHRQ